MKNLYFYLFLLICISGFGQKATVDFKQTISDIDKANALEKDIEWPISLYEKYRESSVPSKGKAVTLNPTTFFWKSSTKKHTKYLIEYSKDNKPLWI